MAGGDMLNLLIQKDTFPEQMARFYVAEMILAIEEVRASCSDYPWDFVRFFVQTKWALSIETSSRIISYSMGTVSRLSLCALFLILMVRRPFETERFWSGDG
jgi:hypothetical protein